MLTPTPRLLREGRVLLSQDRSGFVAFAPQLGICKSVAAREFGAPRDLDVCLRAYDRFAHAVTSGLPVSVAEAVAVELGALRATLERVGVAGERWAQEIAQ